LNVRKVIIIERAMIKHVTNYLLYIFKQHSVSKGIFNDKEWTKTTN